NIFVAMGEWWKYNPTALVINWKALGSWFCLVRHARMDKAKLDVYRKLFEQLEASPPPDESETKLIMEGLITRDYAAQIGELALKISDEDYAVDVADTVKQEEQGDKAPGKIDKLDKHILLPTLDGLTKSTPPGLKWRLSVLNESLGDLRKGDLVIFGARPDTGKTTFLASEGTFMAQQIDPDAHVLWVNNEEDGDKVISRAIQAALGITTSAMESNM